MPATGVAPATSIRQVAPGAVTSEASQVQSTVGPCPAADGELLPEGVGDGHLPRERRGDAGLEPHEPAEAAGHLRLVELRQPDRLRLRRDRAELRVEEVAGARREPRVAVAGDGAQDDGDAGAIPLAAARDER